ncbi:MAG: STAS domain-containing protein [Pseudomonadota bacterium]
MAEFSFSDAGGGRFALSGVLGFETAGEIVALSRTHFAKHSVIEVDFAGVERSDSAGLAVLLEWVNWAKISVREIHYINIPKQILAIAEISEVDSMLSAGARWTGEH